MPDIGQPSASDKNSDAEIRDAIVSDGTRFPGGFIDEQITQAGADVQFIGQFQIGSGTFFQSLDVSSQTGTAQGLALDPDGTKAFLVGETNESVHQFRLSSPYVLSSATFVTSLSVSSQDVDPVGIEFRTDGTQMYHCGQNNSNIYEYSLSTAYDVSTATFTQSFDVSPQDAQPTGVALQSDGSRMYMVGRNSADVHEYSLSTAYDVSTATFTQSFDVSPQDTDPFGLTFEPDGNELYVVGRGNANAYQYRLSTAYDVSTATFTQALDISPQDSDPRGVAFKPDGGQLYVPGKSTSQIFQYIVGSLGGKLQ